MSRNVSVLTFFFLLTLLYSRYTRARRAIVCRTRIYNIICTVVVAIVTIYNNYRITRVQGDHPTNRQNIIQPTRSTAHRFSVYHRGVARLLLFSRIVVTRFIFFGRPHSAGVRNLLLARPAPLCVRFFLRLSSRAAAWRSRTDSAIHSTECARPPIVQLVVYGCTSGGEEISQKKSLVFFRSRQSFRRLRNMLGIQLRTTCLVNEHH